MSNDLQTILGYIIMINYDIFRHFKNIFFAIHAGAKELIQLYKLMLLLFYFDFVLILGF